MVEKVIQKPGQPPTIHHKAFVPEKAIGQTIVSWCAKFPWEDLIRFGDKTRRQRVTPRPTPPRPPRPPVMPRSVAVRASAAIPAARPVEAPPIDRPGCTAADNAGVVLYHLDGLAYEGKTNFGVLRVSKERLEEGARAAEISGDPQIAEEYRAIARDLPEVHDAEAAQAQAERLRPVAFRAWELGARCKGSISPEQLGRVQLLAKQVREGTITMEQAITQVRQGA